MFGKIHKVEDNFILEQDCGNNSQTTNKSTKINGLDWVNESKITQGKYLFRKYYF